jgi:hypothetical protein
VVRGALALALLSVDVGVGDGLRERLVAVDEVDAHAAVLREGELAVVPVRVRVVVLEGARDHVRQARLAQGGEGGALGRGDVGEALEGGHVEDVVVRRGHVVVAEHRERAAADRVVRDGRLEGLEPLELVRVVGVVHLAAVRHVDRPDADRAAGRGDGAGLLDAVVTGVPGQALDHVVEAYAGEHRHAVPPAGRVDRRLVARSRSSSNGNCASASLASWRHSTSVPLLSSQASSLGRRAVIEFTFQVAIRMPHNLPGGSDTQRSAVSPGRQPQVLRAAERADLAVVDRAGEVGEQGVVDVVGALRLDLADVVDDLGDLAPGGHDREHQRLDGWSGTVRASPGWKTRPPSTR